MEDIHEVTCRINIGGDCDCSGPFKRKEKDMSERLNRENLERLYSLLVQDANDPVGVKFNLGEWAGPSTENWPEGWRPARDCGTSACALGLAAISGQFSGLDVSDGGAPVVRKEGSSTLIGFEAGMEIFGLDRYQAITLFDPYAYSESLRKGREAELEVARRVRWLLDKGSFQGMDTHRRI